jgi:hypothetical protein
MRIYTDAEIQELIAMSKLITGRQQTQMQLINKHYRNNMKLGSSKEFVQRRI